MKRLIVARYKEDTEWVKQASSEWVKIIIQKETEELKGDMPNAGREPASFLFAVAKYYDLIKPDDTWAFVQGNPFPHCTDLVDLLDRPVTDYTPLGGQTFKQCDDAGAPEHPNLPVKELYEKWLKRTCPKVINFTPGGQFMVRGRDLLRYPRSWYIEVMDDATPAWNCYVLERIWSEVYAN
jgi:hypothetical protein